MPAADTQDPPEYVAVVPLRADAPNPTEYGGEKIAAQQRAAYPDIEPLALVLPPRQAFDRALDTARRMGWDIVTADASSGRIEATDTTFWFGFKDDENLRKFVEMGADLVMFSGGKNLQGPQCSGLLLSRKDLIAKAYADSSPHNRFARIAKVGKEEITSRCSGTRRSSA